MSSMRRQTPSGTPLPPRMKEAQAYIRTHTREKVKLTSFDGLELAALYLPVERPRGTVIAFHGYPLPGHHRLRLGGGVPPPAGL